MAMKRTNEVKRLVGGIGWTCQCYLKERGSGFAASACMFPGNGPGMEGEQPMTMFAKHRVADKAEEQVVAKVQGWVEATPTGRTIIRLEDEARTAEREGSERYELANHIQERISELRIKEFMEPVATGLQPFLWRPGHVGLVSPLSVILTAEGPDEDNDALHDALGFSYHGQVELAPGVQLIANDGEIRMKVETVEALLDLASKHRLRVEWGTFKDGLDALDQHLLEAKELREILGPLVAATHPADPE